METVLDKAKKKNYYFLQTIKEEISTYRIISFDMFDTLILRKVLFPQDLFKVLSNWTQQTYGIMDFRYIRPNVEQDVRAHSREEEITLDDIYDEIKRRYPDWDTESIKQKELSIELENCIVNPYVKEIYEEAKKAGIRIFIISDMYLPFETVEGILQKTGYSGYEKLYLSSMEMKVKSTGNLYRKIIDEAAQTTEGWLHLGDNWESDVSVPRSLGITAGYIKSPKDWFMNAREEEHQKEEEAAGEALAWDKINDDLDYSIATANRINKEYTQYSAPQGDTVITADDVSIMFNMSDEKVDNIKEYVIRLLKKQLNFQAFWALKHVSFSVRQGERVGLIGLNGSGKSTMLKVISGVLKPTSGKVSVYGSIAPLIELGAGFDMELSAQENIYLNGAILGYGREEMKSYYEEIISFSELKQFENVAIKNFSSGMIARLGFAIATCHKPDILIIDEILAVGDFEFQKKCHKRMRELTDAGTTVLFVSHSANDIIQMCDRVVWLDHGDVVQQGESQYIVEKYLNK